MENNNYLTTGELITGLFKISLPIIVSNLLQSVLEIVDRVAKSWRQSFTEKSPSTPKDSCSAPANYFPVISKCAFYGTWYEQN